MSDYDMRQDLVRTRERLTLAEQEVASLREEMKDILIQAQAPCSNCFRLREERDQLNRLAIRDRDAHTELARLRGQYEGAIEEYHECAEERDRLREDLKNAQDWYRAAKDALASLREERDDALNTVEDLDRREKNLREDKERLWQKCRERGDELAKLREEWPKSKAEYARLREENENLKERSTVRAFDKVWAERDRLRAELRTTAEHSVKGWEEERRLRETNEKLIADVNFLGQRMAEASDEGGKWKARYLFVKSELDRMVLERRIDSGTA